MSAAIHLLAALTWDPQIRGALIFITAVVILAGSVFLLLSTNVGVRVGALLALAGLSGWMILLGLLWSFKPSTTGPQGRTPVWKVTGVVTGSAVGQTARPPLDTYPNGWKKLAESDAETAEVTTSAGEYLASDEGSSFGLTKSTDYIVDESRDKGGERTGPFGALNFRPFNVFHDTHYAVVRVQPAIKVEAKPGEKPPEPQPDTSKEPLNILLVRDLGSRRLPLLLFTGANMIFFGVVLSVLHRRDKIAMAARGALPAGAG